MKRYFCDLCEQEFKSKFILNNHMMIHLGLFPHICKVCGRKFRQRSSLVVHSRTHTGEKPFKCDICSRDFGQRSTLARHVMTHTGMKPYVCEFIFPSGMQCGKDFARPNALDKHMRTKHGNEVLHLACRFCPKRFTHTSNLNKHEAVKHGLHDDFICAYCPKKFSQLKDIKSHCVKRHPGELIKYDVVSKELKNFFADGQKKDGEADLNDSFNTEIIPINGKDDDDCSDDDDEDDDGSLLEDIESMEGYGSDGEKIIPCDFDTEDDDSPRGPQGSSTGIETLQCKICSLFFSDIDELRCHMELHCSLVKRFRLKTNHVKANQTVNDVVV